MKYFFVPLLFWVLLSSCSTSRGQQFYQNVQSNEVEVGFIEDSLFMVEVAYVGAIGHSFIFECLVKNNSSESVVIDKSQFSMQLIDGQVLSPIVEDDIISKLKKEKKKLKKRRKTETILGAVTVGLFAALGASEGFSPAETLLFSAEPIFYIFDDRRWYKNNIDSIDDEAAYIQAAQFHYMDLPPKQSIVRDILFPTSKIKGDVNIIFHIHEQEYIITFPRETFQ